MDLQDSLNLPFALILGLNGPACIFRADVGLSENLCSCRTFCDLKD